MLLLRLVAVVTAVYKVVQTTSAMLDAEALCAVHTAVPHGEAPDGVPTSSAVHVYSNGTACSVRECV